MNTKKKKFTEEFKREAIKLVTEQGYSQSEAGRSLGVDYRNINRWLKESKTQKSSCDKGVKIDVTEELNRLRKENHRLKLEREILKKAAAFFANESC